MFAGTPYEHVPLGTRPSFDATTAEMLKKFHTDWYAPNNAVLVIVGDVDTKATLAKVKNLFGALKPKRLPAHPKMNFAPQKAASFKLETDKPNATAIVAMRLPGLDSPDFPALEVLSDVLSSERFDLYGLVPAGKALSAGFSLDPLPRASLAYAEISIPAGGDTKAAENEIRAILGNVIRRGVPADLVAAAKIQERRATEFQKNGIEDLAAVWSDAITLYGLHSPDEDLRRIEKVTIADVNRVARKYLDLDHAVVAVMTPQPSGQPVASGKSFGGQETIAMPEADAVKLPDWAEKALGRLAVPPSTLNPVVSTLPNGITLIVQPEDVSDTVCVYGRVRGRPVCRRRPARTASRNCWSKLFHLWRPKSSTGSPYEGAGRYRRQRERRDEFLRPCPEPRFRPRPASSSPATSASGDAADGHGYRPAPDGQGRRVAQQTVATLPRGPFVALCSRKTIPRCAMPHRNRSQALRAAMFSPMPRTLSAPT